MKYGLLLIATISVADCVFFAKSMQKRVKEDFKPKLPFFVNCTSDQIHEFFSITRNRSLPKEEIVERTRIWAEARGNATLDLYTQYIAALHKKKDAAYNTLKKVFAELPEVLQKYHEAREDMSITGEEEEQRLIAALDSFSPETRKAFVYLITAHYPRGVNDSKRKPFIPSPRKNGENRNKGPYGGHKKIPVEEEAL